MNRHLSVAFDVDGTLIGLDDMRPKYPVINLFRTFEAVGCTMYIWSAGGLDYATMVAARLGLRAKIVQKGSFRPDIAVDDHAVTLGVVNMRIEPEEPDEVNDL